MELDDLKQVWQEQPAGPEAEKEALQQLMLGKSKGPIARIRQNLNRELIAVLVIYAAAIAYYLLANRILYWDMVLLLVLVLVFFLGYYIGKNRLLRDMESVQGDVKGHLTRKLQLLEKYIRFYFISGTIMAPVAFLLAAVLMFSKDPLGAVRFPHFYATIGVVALLITVASYFLNKWYVWRLYGRHVTRMKEIMGQLDDGTMRQ